MKTTGLTTAGAIALAAMVAGVAIEAQAGEKLERSERRVVDAAGGSTIEVYNPRGKTVIVGRDGANEVVVVATKVALTSEASKSEELLARLHYEVRQSGERVIVRTVTDGLDSERSWWSVLRGERDVARIDYAVEIPRRFSVETSTTSGEVRVRNIAGSATVRGTSGAVFLRDVDGAAAIAVSSGAVDARDVRGNLVITASSGRTVVDGVGGSLILTASSGGAEVARVAGDAQVQLVTGDLQLRGCLGDVTFSTSSGNAEILDVDGSVNAVTSSGDIDVMILPVGQKSFTLSSSSGNIGVRYLTPADYGFLLDVSTSTGSIEGDMAIKVDKISRRELKGVVGTGTSRVMIETASGDVVIAEKNGSKKTGQHRK